MNSDRIKSTKVKGHKKKPRKSDHLDSVTQPLRKMNNVPNSIHLMTSQEDELQNPHKNRNASGRIRLSQIPHIDSSSEDELGTRAMMGPNSDLSESRESVSMIKSRLPEVATMRID